MRSVSKRWMRFCHRCVPRRAADQTGQSVIIIAVAFVALLVIIGLAVDLGLMYIERVKIGRACDAAALAAAQDLPFEEFAARRAITYLAENGYDATNTELVVLGPANAAALSQPAPSGSRGRIVIDMETYEDADHDDPDNSADKIKVYGQINVVMNFMQLIGFRTVPVEAQAIAENVSSLDIAIVYDKSGSMQEDTYCFRDNSGNPCYIRGSSTYPAGDRLYVPYATWIATPLDPPLKYNNYEILVAEAEYFSYSTSFSEHPYQREYYEAPGTFWMIQRVQNSQASGYRYTANDRRGVHLMHMPHRADLPGHSEVTAAAPRLDYNFTIPDSTPLPSTWYVWIRAQCGNYEGNSSRTDSCIAHWGVDGNWRNGESTNYDDFGLRGGDGTGSNGYNWRWVRLGSLNQTDRNVQINIWGGGTGFRLDKVLITRNSNGPDTGYTDRAPDFIRSTTPSWSSVSSQTYQTYSYNSRYGGPADTGGRDGLATNECNPIYGQRVNPGCAPGQSPDASCRDLDGNTRVDYYEICDNTQDDIYDDKQPIRASKVAATNFAKRLKARYDQLGFVAYSEFVDMDDDGRELNCVKRPGTQTMPDGVPGVWDPDAGPDIAWTYCYDHRTGTGGYTGAQDTDLIDGSILGAIESVDSAGWTNMPAGMMEGMTVLGSTPGHYGRANAVKVMILMTDGVANRWPGYSSCAAGTCCAADIFQPNYGDTNENRAADCSFYYAQRARNSGIAIYTIGLGVGSERATPLLKAIADETGGLYYFAPRAQDLDAIFQRIADQIFLRLVE